MKIKIILGLCIAITSSMCLSGCKKVEDDNEKILNAKAGKVVELEGEQDQYGWFPHMRLTFGEKELSEIYFDYINSEGIRKTRDEEYNATMKEKTGMSTIEAIDDLIKQLEKTKDPTKIDVVTGATQTSVEFMTMAKQAYNQYFNGENSANNYKKGDPMTSEDDEELSEIGEYNNGGDASPNSPENINNK
ncbi:MAG: FMN-binding protein [Cellulosilyticaceae bacterium]